AMRAADGKTTLGDIHATLYTSIAAVPGTYAAALGDVVDGTNGTCATCRAGTGFDQTTGWGTPNAAQLLATLSGTAAPLAATPTTGPVIAGTGSYKGVAGVRFSATLTASNPSGGTLTYSLANAPSGFLFNSAG